MSDSPKKTIQQPGAEPAGTISELGLNMATATADDCRNAMEYITEGIVSIKPMGHGYALIGDGSLDAQMFGGFFERALHNPESEGVPALHRLARAINRMASSMDASTPIRTPGVPSRMQMLHIMQRDMGPAR